MFEAFSLLGRNLKTQWRAAWVTVPPPRRRAQALRSPLLMQSYDAYLKGFRQDLNHASQIGKAVVEVREEGVEQDGIAGDRVRIPYTEHNESDVMLQLVATFARWHRQARRVHVVPLKHVCREGQISEVGSDWLRTRVKQAGFRCQYQVLDGDYPSELRDVELYSIEGRLYFTATQLVSGARLRLRITTSDGIFVSDFENIDDVSLRMSLDAPENQAQDPRPRGLETVLRVG